MEPLIHKSDYQSDKSFDELGIMCDNDICNSPIQEGRSQNNQGLVCKIDEIKHPLFTPNTWYGGSCASYTIDNNELGLFDSKDVNETITGIAG